MYNGVFTCTYPPEWVCYGGFVEGVNMPRTEPAAQWVAIDKLMPWADNPRINEHAVEDVAKSIQRFGFASPIIARTENNEVIAGHTRLKAAIKLGLDRVPVRFMDLDPADARMLALADNRVAELADWDDDALAAILKELDADGLDLDGLGWDDDALADLLAPDPLEPDGTEDDVPEVQEEVHSQPGEVYELGPHRLMCGDCRSASDVSTLLNGVLVNVAFTSPPYASQRKYDESSGFKPIKPDAYVEWFETVQANVREHLAEDGSWFVNIKEHCEDGQRSLYVKDLTIAHVRAWGWRFVDELCWSKQGMPGLFGDRLKNEFEPVFHFTTKGKVKTRFDSVSHKSGNVPFASKGSNSCLQGIEDPFIGRGEGFALPGNVLRIPPDSAGVGTHAARFPVGLPAFFVKAYSDEGDAILDPFMGSGTTLIAAAQESRVAYGMEISPGYCDVIRRRWTTWAKKHDKEPGPGALE